jgi:hypothetical protein
MERDVDRRSRAAETSVREETGLSLLPDMLRQVSAEVAVIDRQLRYVAVSDRWLRAQAL